MNELLIERIKSATQIVALMVEIKKVDKAIAGEFKKVFDSASSFLQHQFRTETKDSDIPERIDFQSQPLNIPK